MFIPVSSKLGGQEVAWVHFATGDVYFAQRFLPPLSLDLEFILAAENPWITQS